MSRSLLIGLLIALALLGIGDSIYLSLHAAEGTPLTCDIGAGLDGCNIVAQSPYSRFLGIPLAYYGLAFYALLLIGGIAALWKHHRHIHRALLAVCALGAVFSVWFLYIQFALIKALCIYCLVSAAVAFTALVLSLWLDLRHKNLPAVVPAS